VRGEGGLRVTEPDTRVQDPMALAEIQLFGDLVIAASSSDGRLSQGEIDRALGLNDS